MPHSLPSVNDVLPRIAVCGISLEASTFSPALTTVEMLAPRRGDDVLAAWDFWRPGGSLVQRRSGPDPAGALDPRGPVPAEDYRVLKEEILAGLRAGPGPLDGLVFDIHGAMSVIGLDDTEGDLAVAVREVVGPDV